MSKIFDALRKAEQEPLDLIAPPVEPELQRDVAMPRDVRTLEAEFGRLGSAVQSYFAKSKDGRIVLVVGAREREGATYVASHLGRTLAVEGGSAVLCLDANFRSPGLARHTGAKSGLGMSDVAETRMPRDLTDVIQRGDVANLYVLPSGRKRISPVSFFDNPQFDLILAGLRRNFRYTVVDGAPLLAHPDSMHLATRADGVILVVRHGRLKREVLKKAVDLLESVHAPILGVVLNRRRFAIPTFLYKLIS